GGILVHILRRDSLDGFDVHLVIGFHRFSLIVQWCAGGGFRRPYVAMIERSVCRSRWAVEGFLESGNVLDCSQHSVERRRVGVGENLKQCIDGRRRVFAPDLNITNGVGDGHAHS
ncbi:hypothetical protein PENTCL1PPCAC_21536, partial [Pristionchus entomophagus]